MMITMDLYELRLRPRSSWRTPWCADTIFGLLCWARARRDGGARLRDEILDPSLAGAPPFVVSDAFPTGWMPVPATLRGGDSLERYRRRYPSERSIVVKRVRKTRWMTDAGFAMVQHGQDAPIEDFSRDDVIRSVDDIQNQIGRDSNTTSTGGRLFVSESWALRGPNTELTIYVRTTQQDLDRLNELFRELESTGFGADVSTGKGEFVITSPLTPCPRWDQVPGANASIVLSSFQPAAGDPVDGFWDSFIKHGKLGPDFGLDNVFKRPMVLLRPGAVFLEPRAFFGRAVPADQYLAPEALEQLGNASVFPIHPAFGLAFPATIL